MLPAAMLFATAAALAQTPAPAAQDRQAATPADGGQRQQQTVPKATNTQQGKKMMPAKSESPDAALLEYLGEFDDAADGLDAMGLADPQTPQGKPGGGENTQR